MVFNPTTKIGQTRKLKSFYFGPQKIRESINDLLFVIEDVKTKKNDKTSTTIDSNALTVEVPPLKKKPKKAKSEPSISQNDLTEDNNFVVIEVVTPKTDDTSEVNPEENNDQSNPSTETQNETVMKEMFDTQMSGSTIDSKTANTKYKSRSTKIPAPKVATQQKRHSLLETTERSEGEEFSNRSAASN